MSVCAQCGKENQAHYKFCLGCGGELDESAPSKPVGPRSADVRAAPTLQTEAPRPPTAPPVFGDMGPPNDPVTDPSMPALYEELSPQNGGAPSYTPSPGPVKSGTRSCGSCGTVVGPGFRFCPSCGGPMEDAPSPARVTGSGLPKAKAQVAAAPKGSLVLVRPDGTEGGTHPLVEGENPIGRGMGALFEADGYLSPLHAEVVLNAAGLVVRDTNSLNGVFVKLLDEEELIDGDIFRIGQELLRFDVIPAPSTLDDGTEILGSPNPGYWGRLAVIVGRDQDGSAFPLMGDAIILGRERGDLMFPEDGYVSGTHARVSIREGRYYLADLSSSNGTFVRIRGERLVQSGAFVLMGQQLFRVAF